MKQSFPEFVLAELSNDWVKSDEELCSKYIQKYYKRFLASSVFLESSIAVIGKRYESARKQLWEMCKNNKIEEVSDLRIHRKNGSDEIFFKKV